MIEKAAGHVILLCGSDGLWQQVVAFARALNQDVARGTDVVVLCPQVPSQDLQMSINWKRVSPQLSITPVTKHLAVETDGGSRQSKKAGRSISGADHLTLQSDPFFAIRWAFFQLQRSRSLLAESGQGWVTVDLI